MRVEIETFRLPVADRFRFIEQVNATNQFVKSTDAELRHDLTRFFGDEEEIVHHVFRLTRELLTQFRILRRHANWAGIQMALAHHDAAFNHQWRRRKTDFIGTQHGGDDDVTTGLHLTISLHTNTATQTV